jgi:hypothetical protein
MQIDIDENIIKESLEKKVSKVVGGWIDNNKSFIENAIRKEINYQIGIRYCDAVSNAMENISKEELLKKVSERISQDVAEAIAERFGG